MPELRRILRIAGVLDESDDPKEMVASIKEELRGPMLLLEHFPESGRMRQARQAVSAYARNKGDLLRAMDEVTFHDFARGPL